MKNLQTIKFIKKDKKPIILNGREYTPFKVGDLPNRFGYIFDLDNESEGISEWFNYKGLTYINLN